MNIPNIAESARNSQLQEQNDFLQGQNQALAAIINYLVITHIEGGNVQVPINFNEAIKGTDFQLIPNEEGYLITSAPTITE